MANDLSARPWYIDTAGVSVIYPYQCYIKFVEVVGGGAGALGDPMATLNDKNSKNIIKALFQTTNAGEVQTYNIENWFEGLIVSALGTGVTLRIHVK